MSVISDKKFINLASHTLRNFKWKKNDLANCSCPVCGDSKRDKKKARGYFYLKHGKFFFKCHNCGYWSNLYRFLQELYPDLHKEYCLDFWRSNSNNTEDAKSDKEKSMLGMLKKMKGGKGLNKDLFGSRKICDLEDNHPARSFIEIRKIPKKYWDIIYFTEEFGKLAKRLDPDSTLMPFEPRIVIPFFNKKGNVVAVQGRSIKMADENNARKTVKYITVKADKSIDRLWYGMWRANPSERVYVVEGPLDSLFIDNCIAMVGAGNASKIPDRFKDSDIVFVLDNEPRNKQVVQYNEELIKMGHKVCIWPKGMKEKDINDMALHMKKREIKKIIDSNTAAGLEANLKLNAWRV